jgi:hypothetical protein
MQHDRRRDSLVARSVRHRLIGLSIAVASLGPVGRASAQTGAVHVDVNGFGT